MEFSPPRGCTGLLAVNWVILFKFVKNCPNKREHHFIDCKLNQTKSGTGELCKEEEKEEEEEDC